MVRNCSKKNEYGENPFQLNYTGVSLENYFNANTEDPFNARRIINGLDCAKLIEGNYRKFLSALRICISVTGVSQNVNEEYKAFFRTIYAFTQKDYTRESLISRTDTMSLDIGYRLSEFYDLTAFAKDSLQKRVLHTGNVKSVNVIKNQLIAESVINTNRTGSGNVFLPNRYISFSIFKDRNKKHVYTLDKDLDGAGTSVFLEEEIYPQEWTIDNDTCIILNYLCYKATTKFRGREYEVYFAPEIPINEGPWKLYGLPGLILEAKTTDGIFSFRAIGIQEINNKSITIPDGKDSEICKDLKQYNQFVQSKGKNERFIFEKSGVITIADRFSSKKVILLETDEN